MVGRHARTLEAEATSTRAGLTSGVRAPALGVENRVQAPEPPSPAAPEGLRDGAAGALENHPDKCSTTGPKYAALDELRKFTTLPRQRSCMTETRAQTVTLGRRDGRMVLGSVLPCGLRFCPNCAPRIQGGRRDDIRGCVDAAQALGWTTLFLTLTVRHAAGDGLADLLDGLDSSWRALTRGGFWTRTRARFGLRHYVRVTEEQEGGAHGWHPHMHLLLWLEPLDSGPVNVDELGSLLVDEWARVTAAAGYAATDSGQRLVQASDEHLDRLTGYFTKQLSDDLAIELTGAATKLGKNGSRNPAQLLADAVAGDTTARRHWRELEEASRGRRMIGWSNGAREDLRMPPPPSSDELAREEPPAPAECLVRIHREDFREHAFRAGFREQLALVVETAELPEEVLWWLELRGLRVTLAAPPVRPSPAISDPGPPDRPWLALPDASGGFS